MEFTFNDDSMPPVVNTTLESICAEIMSPRLTAEKKTEVCRSLFNLYKDHLCCIGFSRPSTSAGSPQGAARYNHILTRLDSMSELLNQIANRNNHDQTLAAPQPVLQVPRLKRVILVAPGKISGSKFAGEFIKRIVPSGTCRLAGLKYAENNTYLLIDVDDTALNSITGAHPDGSFELADGAYNWILEPLMVRCSKCTREVCSLAGVEPICGSCARSTTPEQPSQPAQNSRPQRRQPQTQTSQPHQQQTSQPPQQQTSQPPQQPAPSRCQECIQRGGRPKKNSKTKKHNRRGGHGKQFREQESGQRRQNEDRSEPQSMQKQNSQFRDWQFPMVPLLQWFNDRPASQQWRTPSNDWPDLPRRAFPWLSGFN